MVSEATRLLRRTGPRALSGARFLRSVSSPSSHFISGADRSTCVLFCFSAPTSCLLTPRFWTTARTTDCMATSCMWTCTARAFSACAVPFAASSPPKVTLAEFLFQHGLRGLEGTRDQLPHEFRIVLLTGHPVCWYAVLPGPCTTQRLSSSAVCFVPLSVLCLLRVLPSPLLRTPSILFCPTTPLPQLPPCSQRNLVTVAAGPVECMFRGENTAPSAPGAEKGLEEGRGVAWPCCSA